MSRRQTHICPACETAQPEGDGFCDECGTQLVPQRYCDRCGVIALHTGEFCRECGTKLPALPAPSTPPADRPAWLSEPDPPAAPPPKKDEPKPAWLREPEPKPLLPRDKPAPAAKKPERAPLARRPNAAPVPMRPAPLAPAPSAAGNALTLVSATAGILGVVTAATSLPLALVLFVIMLATGGQRLRHGSADAVGRVVDWLWEDPVLRKRMLGE